MSKWKNWKTSIGRMALSAVAIAALASLVTYETAKPMAARASVAAACSTARRQQRGGVALTRSGNGNFGRESNSRHRERRRHCKRQGRYGRTAADP